MRKLWEQFAGCDDSVSQRLYERLSRWLRLIAKNKLFGSNRIFAEDVVAETLAYSIWMVKQDDKNKGIPLDKMFLPAVPQPDAYLRRILNNKCTDINRASTFRESLSVEEIKRILGMEEKEPPMGWDQVYEAALKTFPPYQQKIWQQHCENYSVKDMEQEDGEGKPLNDYKIRQILNQIRQHLADLKKRYLNGEL